MPARHSRKKALDALQKNSRHSLSEKRALKRGHPVKENIRQALQPEALGSRIGETSVGHFLKPFMIVQALTLYLMMTLSGQALAQDHQIKSLPEEKEIATYITPLLESDAYLGIVIGIVGPTDRRIFGFGSLSRRSIVKPSGESVYPLASVTKTFTGVLLADFVSRGIVRLDDTIAKYLPHEVIQPGGPLSDVTLLDLATHTSGLPRMPNNMVSPYVGKAITPYSAAQLYKFLNRYSPLKQPGQEFRYSNVGIALLGHILELASGLPYEKLVEDRICEPLDMSSTRIAPDESMRRRLARGYDKNLKPVELQIYNVGKGSGGLYSTGNDMLKYLAANIGLSQARIVPALLESQAPLRQVPGKQNEFMGLTWQINTVRGRQIISKNGEIVGYQSFIAFSRADKVGIVALANGCPETGKLDTAARKILWSILANMQR